MYTKNMRYFGLLLLCLCWTGAHAAPYSHLENFFPKQTQPLIAHIAQQKPISFCVAFSDQIKHTLQRQQQNIQQEQEDLSLHLNAALRSWTQGTAAYIRQSGRGEEFADLLPLLEKAQFVQLKNCNLSAGEDAAAFFEADQHGPQADLSILVAPDYCATLSNHVNSFFTAQLPVGPVICVLPGANLSLLTPATDPRVRSIVRTEQDRALSAQAKPILAQAAAGNATADTWPLLWKLDRFVSYEAGGLFSLLVHEIGHALGLADEYSTAHADPLYASLETHPGIMRRQYDRAGCSEADGIVTLLDRSLGTTRTFASFCEDGAVFTNGIQQVKKPTPAKLVIRQGATVLYSLLADSPQTKTMQAEIWEQEPSAQTQEILTQAGLPANGYSFYSRGRQKTDTQRTGNWQILVKEGEKYTAITARYNQSGTLVLVRTAPAPKEQAASHFEKINQLIHLNIARTEKNLKAWL